MATDTPTIQPVKAADKIQMIQALRALADWLERTPDADCGVYGSGNVLRVLDARPHSAEDMGELARRIGGHWEKQLSHDGLYFELLQQVAPGVEYQLYADRDEVCERVVVGTEEQEMPDPDALAAVPRVTQTVEKVEWRCPPSILGGDLERKRAERQASVDDVVVKVASDVFGPRVSQAVRAGTEAERAGATPEEAEEIASEALRRQHAAEDALGGDEA